MKWTNSPNLIDEEDCNREDADPRACHVEPLLPADIVGPESRSDQYQEADKRNQRYDLVFVHATISNPSKPTVTPLGTSSHRLR